MLQLTSTAENKLNQFSHVNMNALIGGHFGAIEQPPKHNVNPVTIPLAKQPDHIPLGGNALSSLSTLVDYMMEAMIVVDEFGNIQMANTHAAALLLSPSANNTASAFKSHLGENSATQSSVNSLLGRRWQSYLCEPQKSLYQSMIIASQIAPRPLNHLPTETTLNLSNGQSIDVEMSVTHFPMTAPLFGIILRDLSQFRAEYQQLYKWASTDCLTELANRRVFDADLKHHWKNCLEQGDPISVLIIDIDHFKSFNDNHGHVMGDRCLQKIAKAIKSALPNEDCTAARYGGEEFALVMPNCNTEEVQQTAQLIQQNINALTYIDIGLDISVTVSVSQGHASEINGQFRTANALLCAADTALYRAKADGRNRINACC
ncbi:GGDEF domain-containing protein [Shewanella sp. MMG014]|uniref:sensor domain-containing diguanylate cyclase n=1 Tax=unclassified Shewanella TaxID=196818 RepID=UPI0009ECD30F|nr:MULTISPECIES: GGDEF domain-containing protein [unclassified Shewanella]MBQ4890730.1 GGDEF domain-containing protein [Shewanella sp. MMG014]